MLTIYYNLKPSTFTKCSIHEVDGIIKEHEDACIHSSRFLIEPIIITGFKYEVL